jgi:hypothetical protein
MLETIAISFFGIALLTQAFRTLDWLIRRAGFIRPYYAVHVLHNAGIVFLTAGDVYTTFTLAPADIIVQPLNGIAACLCIALHVYHVIDYFRDLRFDDWLHHGLMIGIVIPLGLLGEAGSLFGCTLFFTTGLPGGISYALLFAERNGWMKRAAVQKWNARVHTWIRAPGCIASATVILLSRSVGDLVSSPEIHQMSGYIVAALTGWNGLYFMEQAITARAAVPLLQNMRDQWV